MSDPLAAILAEGDRMRAALERIAEIAAQALGDQPTNDQGVTGGTARFR